MGQDARLEPVKETIPLELPNGRAIKLGTGLQPEQRDILTPTLINNTDLFAWLAVDLPGGPVCLPQKTQVWRTTTISGQGRGRQVAQRRVYRRSPLHHLALQCGSGQESQWQVVDVC